MILYELLAYKLPYALSNVLHQAVETIRVTEPPALSSIDRAFRGDVETIVGKALEKETTAAEPQPTSAASCTMPNDRDKPEILALAEARNHPWDEANATIHKTLQLNTDNDADNLFTLAMIDKGPGENARC